MITLPRPTREVVHQPTREVVPRQAETFKFSTDPELVAKVTYVVGLYLNPPENALVLSVDELGRDEAR